MTTLAEKYRRLTDHETKSLPQLEKELDIIFGTFIKLRDCDQYGMITCFVTGARIKLKDAHAAHFIPRGQMPTRYHEENVHATSIDSNCFDEKHDIQYEQKMIDHYGIDNVTRLVTLGVRLQKFMRFELEEKISHYKEEVSRLKKEKGL